MENPFGNSLMQLEAETADSPSFSRAERRDQQTQRIMEAAKTCFVRSGFQGASMQQICAEAGMSPGALYRYFASKEAIIEAICEADRRADAEIFETVLSNPDAVEGMVYGAISHIRFVHETDAAPLFAQICAEAMRNGAVENMCRTHMEHVQRRFHDYLSNAKARGEIDPPVEIEIVVSTLMAIVHGMALNDLPSQGIPLAKLETIIRASLVGMLRPTGIRHS